jgi:signal transduction histidine kinase
VFESFYTTKEHGLGLGLSISRNIIVSHGGRIWVESNGDRPGAAFLFEIPVRSTVKAGGEARVATVADIPRPAPTAPSRAD